MWKTLAALPVPIFLMVIFSLAVLPTDTAFEQPSLLLILNTLVISGASFAVTYLSLRGYLASGAPGLLLLGPGVLWVGVSSFAAAWLIDAAASPNAGVTIHNIGVFLGSALHRASAAGLRMTPTADPRRRKQMAGWALILVPLSVALVAMASLKGVLPPFFVPGAGPTPLRQAVLGGAILVLPRPLAVQCGTLRRVSGPGRREPAGLGGTRRPVCRKRVLSGRHMGSTPGNASEAGAAGTSRHGAPSCGQGNVRNPAGVDSGGDCILRPGRPGLALERGSGATGGMRSA